jgi:hypothetical protein
MLRGRAPRPSRRYGRDGRALDPMAWLVRWLRAAERSPGLRALGTASHSPLAPELATEFEAVWGAQAKSQRAAP